MTNKEAIEVLKARISIYDCCKADHEANEAIYLAIKALKEKRSHGEWIKWNFKTFGAFGDWEYKCSNCEKVYDGEYKFCPNCGSDMRKGGAEMKNTDPIIKAIQENNAKYDERPNIDFSRMSCDLGGGKE